MSCVQDIELLDEEINRVDEDICNLHILKKELIRQKRKLLEQLQIQKRIISEINEPDWCSHNFPWSSHILDSCRYDFKFQDIRESQLSVMNASLSHYDVFAVMKTSGGKSLCFQLPAICDKSGFTLVVCPLISLIRDQVCNMNATLPGSAYGILQNQSETLKKMLSDSSAKLFYVTPEKILKSKTVMSTLQKAYANNHLNRIVLDEAHCASQWGHDFRPDYAKLNILRTVFPTVPIMMLTATANESVRKDVMRIMQVGSHYSEDVDGVSECRTCVSDLVTSSSDLSRPPDISNHNGGIGGKAPFNAGASARRPIKGVKVFVSDLERHNLQYQVIRKPDTFEQCVDLVHSLLPARNGGNAIVYCLSQKECENMSSALCDTYGVRSAAYHAGLSDDYRNTCQDRWSSGTIQVICATIAFGLGINMPNVRTVIHYTISKSLELYSQETGRAGRDNAFARCVVLYSPEDVIRIACMNVGDVYLLPRGKTRPKVFSMVNYCHSLRCRREIFREGLNLADELSLNSSSFEQRQKKALPTSCLSSATRCAMCDNCSRRHDASPSTMRTSAGAGASPPPPEVNILLKSIMDTCLQHRNGNDGNEGDTSSGGLTLKKIVQSGGVKKALKRVNESASKRSSSSSDSLDEWGTCDVEYLVLAMVERNMLELKFHFTPYSTLCYIVVGDNCNYDNRSSSGDLLSFQNYSHEHFIKFTTMKSLNFANEQEKECSGKHPVAYGTLLSAKDCAEDGGGDKRLGQSQDASLACSQDMYMTKRRKVSGGDRACDTNQRVICVTTTATAGDAKSGDGRCFDQDGVIDLT